MEDNIEKLENTIERLENENVLLKIELQAVRNELEEALRYQKDLWNVLDHIHCKARSAL